ncbi:META domain-containing protein [Shewanella sp.]|uniref:META domain-containing protein n=1 Tax=Shewanella sp. TaxID=50422 RepID=UPI00356605C1
MIKKLAPIAVAILAVAGCQTTPSSTTPEPLLLGSWHIEQVYDHPVIDYSPAQLIFEPKGKLTGNNSCNHFFGSYIQDGNQLTLMPAGTTRKACVDALMIQETRVSDALPKVHSFREAKGKMLLLDETGQTIVIMSRF